MALRDFWIHVRTAAGLFTPRGIVDSPRLDAEAIEGSLRGSTQWLTPHTVDGFDEEDFSFLPDTERARLARLVAEFREVASTVSPMAPAPDAAVERALPLLREIVQALEFDRYGDAEALRLGKRIEQAIRPYRPQELPELRFHTGPDHSGDPALWIWAFLSAGVSEDDEQFLKAAQALRDLLDTVARREAPERWPYISFRSLTEQSEPVEAT